RKFPLAELRLLASARSAGKKMKFRGADVAVQELTDDSLKGVDIALFSAGGAQSKRFAPAAVRAGAVVVDNSSAFRMNADVPLVGPEDNARCICCIRSAAPFPTPCPRTKPRRVPAPPRWKSSANPRARTSKAAASRR